MALSDRNIVITPNTGTGSDPKIVFSGADASTGPQDISLQVYPTSNGTLSFEGSAGQLFSISNSMNGTIFSVNDISGIPSVEILDTGLVKLAQYTGNVVIGNSNDTGQKFQLTGNALVTGAFVVSGTITASNISGTNTGDQSSVSGNAGTATTLATARTIGLSGVTATATSFNGSANILIPVTAVPTTLLTGVVPDANISGSYTGMVNLTGSGSVDFSKFLGLATDLVTTPSYTWTGDTTTGFYRPTTGQVGVAISGVQRALITSTGLTVIGSIGASNLSGTNTGDQINISGNAATSGTASNLIRAGGGSGIQSTTAGTAFGQVVSVREAAGGAGNSGADFAPRLGFHWSGLVASSIALELNGRIAIMNNPGTAYEQLACGALAVTGTVTASGTITGSNLSGTNTGDQSTVTGNAGTATTLATARTIGLSGVTATATSFNGGANIVIPVTAVPTTLLTGIIPDARISGSYTGMVNLTGSGSVDFNKFLGLATDLVSTPSYTWTGDTTTGFYRPTTSQIGVTIGGVQRGLFNTTGLTVTGDVVSSGKLSINAASLPVGTAGSTGAFEIGNGANTGNATMSFHRSGYAINMGLDSDGAFRLGGWSNGLNTYRFTSLTNGNFIVSGAITGTNLSGTNTGDQINISGNAGTISNFVASNSANQVASDSIAQNVIGYTNAIGLFGAPDGALYGQAFSSSWQHQIFGDYRTGQIAVRGKNNNTWQTWRSVLDSSNFNQYVPTLTGTGASGTWNINITGSVASASTAANLSGGTINGNYTVANSISPNTHYLLFGDNTGWTYRFMTNVSGVPTTRFSFRDNGNFTAIGSVSGSNLSGTNTGDQINISGNSGTATNLSTNRDNWNTNGVLSAVVGQLAWRNYGNSHTIFDASASTSPSGTVVNNANSQVAWSGSYPTLMGWNGSLTYGVRVDIARLSESCTGNAATASSATNASQLINGGGFGIQSSTSGTGYQNSINVREAAGGAGNTGAQFAPRLGFHWGGIVASSIAIETNGRIAIRNNPGTAYERLACGDLEVTGSVTASGNVTAFSDERLKTNWRPVCDNFVSRLAEVKSGVYDRTDIENTQVGVSAQSLQQILPNAVMESSDNGMLSVAYGNAAMTSAVELAKYVVVLEERLAKMELLINQLTGK